ncbi:MAG: uracil-xanthine permease family protein [Lachnospiraceae bacterium]|nr:uracil-xanthine permease family protein [Lachnospiraceae bacterium]
MSDEKRKFGEDAIYDAKTLGIPKMLLLGLQHVFAMFGATVLVPLITGLNVSTTLLMAGLGTLLFHFITKGKVPAFLGSSFAFLGGFAAVAPMLADGSPNTEMLPYACGGVVAAGLVYVVVSGLIHVFGIKKVMRFFPPIVTGPIIISIGLILAPSAISNASQNWLLAVIALATIILCNIWGKGMIKIIPIILGIGISYIIAIFMGVVDFTAVSEAKFLQPAPITIAKFDISAILTIMPIALAAMMEHIGDIAAISATVGKNFIADPGLAKTLLGDGLATSLAGMFGGPANTTYGENTGVLALTKVYDPKVIEIAAIIAVLLSFIPKFDAIVNTIPTAIIGGISLILYGMISAIGIRNVVENQVDFTKSRNLIIAAVILVSALGFNSFGGLTIVSTESFTITLSGLAIAAILGIFLNAILPGNDYEFGKDLTGDTSANLQL